MKIEKVRIPKLGIVPAIFIETRHYPVVKVTAIRTGDMIYPFTRNSFGIEGPIRAHRVEFIVQKPPKIHLHTRNPVHMGINIHQFRLTDWVAVTHATYRNHHTTAVSTRGGGHSEKQCKGGKRFTNPDYWAQQAFSKRKKGSLHHMLGIPEKVNLPVTWMKKIVDTPLGEHCSNPTKIGKKGVTVTRLLKQRVLPVLNIAIAQGRVAPR